MFLVSRICAVLSTMLVHQLPGPCVFMSCADFHGLRGQSCITLVFPQRCSFPRGSRELGDSSLGPGARLSRNDNAAAAPAPSEHQQGRDRLCGWVFLLHREDRGLYSYHELVMSMLLNLHGLCLSVFFLSSVFFPRTRDYYCWQCATPTCWTCSAAASSWLCSGCHEIAIVVFSLRTCFRNLWRRCVAYACRLPGCASLATVSPLRFVTCLACVQAYHERPRKRLRCKTTPPW